MFRGVMICERVEYVPKRLNNYFLPKLGSTVVTRDCAILRVAEFGALHGDPSLGFSCADRQTSRLPLMLGHLRPNMTCRSDLRMCGMSNEHSGIVVRRGEKPVMRCPWWRGTRKAR
jgi:hypothetical protein